jgi:hypothetical protein
MIPPFSPPDILGSIECDGRRMTIMRSEFPNGRMAVYLAVGGRIYTRLAVNVPSVDIPDDMFFAKTSDENADLREPLLATGLFEDTGARAQVGFIEFEVWKLRRG